MSRRSFPHSLPRGILNEAREIRVLTSPRRPSLVTEIWTMSSLHLPDVVAPAQYLIDMGLRPALARRISIIYMDFVTRYKQVLELHLRRVIQGGCHLHPEYYRDTFVIQFRDTIRVCESRIMSTAWVCLWQAGAVSTPLGLQRIDVRVDAATKAQILSRLGPRTTSFNIHNRANTIDFVEEDYRKGDSSIKTPSTSSPPGLKSATPSTPDPFSLKVSSTCFPACYPPPLGKSHSLPWKALITSFTRTAPAQTEKLSARSCADMPMLISLLGRMNLSNHDVGTRAQGSPKGLPRNSQSRKTEPLPPLLSPVVVDTSGPSCEPQPSMTGLVSTMKSTNVTRRRRVAPLPNRHSKSETSLPSNSVTRGSCETSRAPPSHMTVGDVNVNAPSRISPHLSPPAQSSTEISSPSTLKPIVPKRRKMVPLPRRASLQPQSTASAERMVPPPPLPGWNASSRPVSRTPSLVSDNSSGIESASSSDELDTPPSTPPSSLHVLSVRGTITGGTSIPPKPTGSKLPLKPSLKDSALPNQIEQSMHTDRTKTVSGQERPLAFTFSA